MLKDTVPLLYVSTYFDDISYANEYAAGLDLCAGQHQLILPGRSAAIATGVSVELPKNHVGLMRGRSGLAFRHRIIAFDGTIDEDYRGELKVLLFNAGTTAYQVVVGDRIAQLVVVPVARCELRRVSELSETARGSSGFGSTGQ